jgi:hypothetical protein
MHANKVVGVHDRMDESIQDNGKVDITIVKHVSIEPVEQKDGDVMVDMQERKLSPLFPQNDENGVPEIPNLRNVEQPQEIC